MTVFDEVFYFFCHRDTEAQSWPNLGLACRPRKRIYRMKTFLTAIGESM
jgi:hypothetical protein